MPDARGTAVPDTALARFQARFTAYIRDPEHAPPPAEVAPERMHLYRRLVFGNCERVMSNMFPVLKKVLPEERWQALAHGFFRDHPMHNPLFQAMPGEFVRYLQARPREADDPPFLLELAHYEWVDYALAVDETELGLAGVAPDGDLLDGRPVLNPLVWMLRYEYPVHTFRDEAPPPSLPAQPTYLVACRDPAYRVVYLELNMVSARLLELVDQHPAASGRELLALIANELAQACDDAFLASGRDTLERMRAMAVLLGTRTTP